MARKVDEGTRYLLVANGAALAASISGIGEAWRDPELKVAFRLLINGFTLGLSLCIALWILALGTTLSLAEFKDEFGRLGFTPRTWKTWRKFKVLLIFWCVVVVSDALVVFRTAQMIGARLGVRLLH